MYYSFISAYANLPNSSRHFWKYKSVLLQILHQYSMPSNITLYFFQLTHYILWSKEPFKEQIFQIFKCSSENLSKSSFLNFQMTNQALSSKLFYFGQKDPINVPILTLSSARMKICQISNVIFQTTSHFFFNFCIILQFHEK